ncbi:TRZ/ATZ family hydrolase [Parachitinimonas caeni]|uniref:5-methylthioadenosine/S-adenosylhomocysteine deaminase n=1 Tax=Parachitinimonas caeni TaxID=3031301 RepID=A0ABT7DY06_9NEIS|nr:TRZ/ATZ family hydrolase [Parachitinimonas caeni]MDK2124951.1 TRZ/ATZ family hydrolase [Parachitinimonas caeni]
MQTVDTLIHARWVIPVAPRGVVLDNHSVAIDGDKIIALLPTSEAKGRYSARHEHQLAEHALIPGLVNLHGHSAMTLLRGLADDLALMDWLNHHIWPAEKRHLSDEFVFDGTCLAMAEMLRSGTTTVNDMYFFHDAVARAGLTARMRTVVGASILEFPTAYGVDAEDYLSKAISSRDRFIGEPLVTFTLAPHAPYTVSDATFRRVVTLAEQLELGVHCHIHETEEEIAGSLKEHGRRPLQRLHELGLLTPNLIAAHMVHTTPEEIELLARQGVTIAHNPASNMKLASGIAQIQAMRDADIAVGIGTDGAASNNKLDMFAEMRLAAFLGKVGGNPKALPAAEVLEMATLGGARALGMADQIGSITPGKQADLAAVDLSALETQPCYDPISHLVYAAGREQVSDVWVAGKALLQSRELTTLNQRELVAKARWWGERVAKA